MRCLAEHPVIDLRRETSAGAFRFAGRKPSRAVVAFILSCRLVTLARGLETVLRCLAMRDGSRFLVSARGLGRILKSRRARSFETFSLPRLETVGVC